MDDDKSFTEAKSFYVDAKFFLEDNTLKEEQVITSPSTGKFKLQFETYKPNFLPKEGKKVKLDNNSTWKKKHQDLEATKLAHVLHYVPVAKRKKGQFPFFGDEELVMMNFQELTLFVAKITKPRLSYQPLKGFVRPSEAPIVEHRCYQRGF